MLLTRHRSPTGEWDGKSNRKFAHPHARSITFEEAEVRGLRDVAARSGRPINDLVRGACLLFLESCGYEVGPDDRPDGACLNAVKAIIGEEDDDA